MSAEPFSLANAEDVFGQAAMERLDETVAQAPPLTPELSERLRALFASARAMRAETPATDAA